MRDNLEEINEKEKQRKRLKEKGKECKKEGKNINDTRGERKKEEKMAYYREGQRRVREGEKETIKKREGEENKDWMKDRKRWNK